MHNAQKELNKRYADQIKEYNLKLSKEKLKPELEREKIEFGKVAIEKFNINTSDIKKW